MKYVINSLGKKREKSGAKFAADGWSWQPNVEGQGSPYLSSSHRQIILECLGEKWGKHRAKSEKLIKPEEC